MRRMRISILIDPSAPSASVMVGSMEPNGTAAPVGAPGENVVNRRPRVGEIADTLRERIISGDLEPGERLVEQTLANDLRVSRMPIREALNILRGQGFVSAIPNRGMVVRPLSDQDIENLFEVREVLDQLTARRAAERATDWEIEQMRLALEGGTTSLGAEVTDAHGRINQGFHDVLTAAAHNDLLVTINEPIEGRLQWLVSRFDHPATYHQEHLAIFDAIRRRDPDAAAAAALAHLRTSHELWRSSQARDRAQVARTR